MTFRRIQVLKSSLNDAAQNVFMKKNKKYQVSACIPKDHQMNTYKLRLMCYK